LAIRSQPGQGTTVTFWLPAEVEGGVAAAPAQPEDDACQAGSRAARILLVDDEQIVRDALATHLVEHGYEVAQAADAATALERLAAGERADLLIADLSMPGMNGIALIREAQRCRPRLPAMLLTGYAGEAAALAVGGAIDGPFSLLHKPITGAQLADRIAMLLETAVEV
jgi:CheY-like chemotaxis protein